MRPLGSDEIVGLETYGRLRPVYRNDVIAHKRARRMSVGEKVTLVFEDRETLRFQVQEMLWVERIVEPDKVQNELDVYNGLMPGSGELSATLFIEITEMPRIRPELEKLVGIDEHVALVVGDGEGEQAIRARFDATQMEEERISAVQYIKFSLTDAQIRQLADATQRARVRIDHPNYGRDEEIPPAVRASLVASLAGEPEPLLHPDALEETGGAPNDVLFASETVRARAAEHPRGPGHIIVEPLAAVPSLLDAPASLMLDLLEGVRRAAAGVMETHGRCRVETELGGESQRLRWHVYAPKD